MRIIQSSITNATVLHNLVRGVKKGTKDVGLEIAEQYLEKGNAGKLLSHTTVDEEKKRNCKNYSKCSTRSQKKCKECDEYFCMKCFNSFHNKN